MTLDEAIEILTVAFRKDVVPDFNEFNQALKLGIEALKRVQGLRCKGWSYWGDMLQGETED